MTEGNDGSVALAAERKRPQRKQYYSYRHVVSFEETNVVGNVYFVRHLSWQGQCREHFLRDNAPRILDELAETLRLVTIHVSCDYYHELFAFDEVEVRMSLLKRDRNRVALNFEYWRLGTLGTSQMVAHGEQVIGCMRLDSGGLVPCTVPIILDEALKKYA